MHKIIYYSSNTSSSNRRHSNSNNNRQQQWQLTTNHCYWRVSLELLHVRPGPQKHSPQGSFYSLLVQYSLQAWCPSCRPPNGVKALKGNTFLTSCAHGDTICPHPAPPPWAPPAPPSRRNVAIISHAEYDPTLTAAAALRVKAALSKAAWWPWPLTFSPWKWCPSHVWRGLSLCQF